MFTFQSVLAPEVSRFRNISIFLTRALSEIELFNFERIGKAVLMITHQVDPKLLTPTSFIFEGKS